MKTAADFLRDAVLTYEVKNKQYGDNPFRCANATQALFPNGINLKTSNDHLRFHILSLIMVKLSRYTVAWDRGEMHKDSIHDATVYCAILEWLDEEILNREKET